MRLVLMTHAETDWNADGRFLGHAEVPLNERGRQQARELQRRLARTPFDEILASDLRRARETAEIVAWPHGLAVASDARLRELDFGAWEGLTYTQIDRKDPNALAAWQESPLEASPPGGESLACLAQRLQAFLQDLERRPAAATFALVAHRGSLRVLLCLLLGVPVTRHWEFRLETAALREVSLVAGSASLVA